MSTIGWILLEMEQDSVADRGLDREKVLRRTKQTQDSLKDEFFSEDRILPFPWVRFGNLDTVKVDVTEGVGEMFHGQLVGLLHI